MRLDARQVLALLLLAVVLVLVPALVVNQAGRQLRELASSEVSDATGAARDRVSASLTSQFEDLKRTAEDWSAWDAMYAFAKDPTDVKWREENFAPESVASLGLSRIGLFDSHGKHILHSDYDHRVGGAADFGLGGVEGELLAGLGPEAELTTTRGGMCTGPDGVLSWAVVKPIRQSDKTGPIKGFLMMVRPMTTDVQTRVELTTGTELRVVGSTGSHGDSREEAADTAGKVATSLPLEGWDGKNLGTLVVGTKVKAMEERRRGLREFAVRSGIVAYVLLSSAALLTISVVWSRRQERQSVEKTSGRLTLVFAGTAGVALTCAGVWAVMNWQDEVHRQEFSRRSGNYAQCVERALAERRDLAKFVEAHLHSKETIDRVDFDRLATNAGLISGETPLWAWMPAGTAGVGAGVIGEGLAGGGALGEGGDGSLVNPASETAAFQRTVGEWDGLAEHISRARDTGEIDAVLLPGGTGEAEGGPSVALIAPVYRTSVGMLMENRREDFRGSLVCVLRLGEVVATAGRGLDYGGLGIRVVGVTARESLPLPVDDENEGVLTRRCTVPISAGLGADLSVTADDRFTYGRQSTLPMGVAAVGVVMTCLLCAFIELNLQRTRRIEHLVAQRTAELEERTRELTAANEAAQAAHQTKSAFLANMSHELRTPMTAILGYTDLLADSNYTPESREEFLRTIRRSAEHLLALINDVLDLSKIEAGRMQAEFMWCETTHVLQDVAMLLREKAARKGLALTIEYLGAVPERIRTDPTRLRQILVNLVGNAVKFTESGGVRSIVRLATEVTAEEPVLSIEVMDSGPGIEAAVLERLFQPFEQGDGSMSRRYGGTGLGLSISRQLAEMLGGTIEASSLPGEGTTFRVTVKTGPLDGVPLLDTPMQMSLELLTPPQAAAEAASGEKQAAPEDASETPSEQAADDGAGQARPMRILLADDTVDNQRLLSFFLRSVVEQLVVVDDGQKAVRAALEASAKGTPFDVVLMDIQMPVLDGFSATRILRAGGYLHPIIALTAHASPADRQKCVDAGCDGFLTKPVNRHELVRRCREYATAMRGATKARAA